MAKEKVIHHNALLGSRELAIFCQQMSVVISSDITILEGVLMLAQQAENRKLRMVLTSVYADMKHDVPFSKAMARHKGFFPAYMLNMLIIGEQSGSLDSTLMRLADYYEKESKIRRKLRTAATYPIVLTVLMVAVILLLIIRILPSFSDILTSVGGEVPPLTQGVLNLGKFFETHGVEIAAVAAGVILVLVIFFSTKGGKYVWSALVMHLPVARTVFMRIVTARFARGLAIQLKAGIPISTALSMIDTLMDNPYVIKKFAQAREDLQDGMDFYDALDSMRLFPPLFMRMTLIGQKTGNLDVMLTRAAGLFEDEVDSSLEKLVTAVEPTLIIILSLVVGVILLSVMLPMINIISSIG